MKQTLWLAFLFCHCDALRADFVLDLSLTPKRWTGPRPSLSITRTKNSSNEALGFLFKGSDDCVDERIRHMKHNNIGIVFFKFYRLINGGKKLIRLEYSRKEFDEERRWGDHKTNTVYNNHDWSPLRTAPNGHARALFWARKPRREVMSSIQFKNIAWNRKESIPVWSCTGPKEKSQNNRKNIVRCTFQRAFCSMTSCDSRLASYLCEVNRRLTVLGWYKPRISNRKLQLK